MKMLVAACVAAAAFVAASSWAALHPSLRPIRLAPLTLAGQGFVPGERIALTLYAESQRTLRVTAGAQGRLTARFGYVPRRCEAWGVRAIGATSGRSWYRSPIPDCKVQGGAGSGPPISGTGIAGIVTRGPITPVCRAEVPCTKPAEGVAVEIAQGGTVLAQPFTGKDGRFYVTMPPGSYTVGVSGRAAGSHDVLVQTGHFTQVAFFIDTGIR